MRALFHELAGRLHEVVRFDYLGLALIARMVHNQAREMAYLDPIWVFAIMALAALLLILLMKKAVARGGLAMH